MKTKKAIVCVLDTRTGKEQKIPGWIIGETVSVAKVDTTVWNRNSYYSVLALCGLRIKGGYSLKREAVHLAEAIVNSLSEEEKELLKDAGRNDRKTEAFQNMLSHLREIMLEVYRSVS